MKQDLEKTVLEAAIAAVHRTTGIELKANPEVKRGNRAIDAEIIIGGHKKTVYAAEVKKWAQQANFGALVNQIQQLPGKGMLVADYVDPKMADRLRELEIPYIDTAGNVYINEKPLYVLVKTTRAQANREPGAKKTEIRGRAFNPTGLKVVYAFMKNEKLLNAPYREIAEQADVALGTVGWVMNDLKQGRFLVEIPHKKRQLKNKQDLLEKWVTAYLEKLRPKLFVGTYTAENEYWWQAFNYLKTEYDAQWGGEVAAAKLTGYLRPEKVIVYLPKFGGEDLFQQQRFRKDPNGNIQVFRAFWERDPKDKNDILDTVDPIIVYADLLETGDVRNLEAAKLLYQNELTEFIR
jgi:hypothetical protein